MSHLTDTVTLFSAIASSRLINAALEGAVLFALTALILHLVPSIRPASRFAVWMGVLTASIALHFFPLHQSYASLPAANAIRISSTWAIALALLWVAIAVFRVSRLALSALHLRRMAASASPIATPPRIAALLEGRRTAQLCSSEQVDRPSVAGFFRPRVLIPAELLSHLSEQELEQIVLHEMEHIRRGDDWTNLLQKLGLALFPLNPALAFIDRSLCMERELACDDCVLRATHSRRSYALCLTNLAEHSFLRRNLSLTLGALGRRSELARRVHRILQQPGHTFSRRTSFAVTGVLMFGVLLGTASLSRVPSLVSFSAPVLSAVTDQGGRLTAQPVMEHGSFKPTMVKAIMPVPSEKPVQDVKAATTKTADHAVRSKATKPKHVAPPQQRLYVQTAFHPKSEMPRVVLTVDRATGSSFAAFNTPNGWLVIQL